MRRKILCVLLAICAVLSIIPAGVIADDSTPSITAYATKNELMTAFTPDSTTGIGENIGKIVFGTYNGNPIEWYILGKDSKISGDNIVIFSATKTVSTNFSDTYWETKIDYSTDWNCVYEEAPEQVVANHYGASKLRSAVLALKTSCFTETEQALMQKTTVSTYDQLNDVNYTTSDYLYLLTAYQQGSSYTKVYGGTDDAIVLDIATYFNNLNPSYYLRHPVNSTMGYYTMIAWFSGYISQNTLTYSVPAVRPVTNLDISKVLFASAAKAATSDDAVYAQINGESMYLRLDGSNVAIGTATYDAEEGTVGVARDESATGNVALVIQGNDGTNDWYYSKLITASEVINVSDISATTGFDVDIAKCQIWLETTIDNVIYATRATGGVYTIAYDANNGEGSMDTQSAYIGIDTKLTANTFTKDGCEFKGWNTSADGTGTAYEDKADVINLTTAKNTTVTLYAQWKKVIKIDGIEDDGTYCGDAEFTVTENADEIDSITAGGTEIFPDADGKYTIDGEGEITVTVTDKEGDKTTFVITLYSEHSQKDDDGDCTTPIGCKHCDEDLVAGKDEHAWSEWELTADGSYIRYCTNDGCTVSDTNYPAPKTGDNSNVITLMALFVVSGGLLSIMFCKAKNNSVKQK